MITAKQNCDTMVKKNRGSQNVFCSWLFFDIVIWSIFYAIPIQQASGQPILTALRYYEAMRLQAKNVTRLGNVDVVIDKDGPELGFCHLPVLLPISQLSDDNRQLILDGDGFQDIATISLAIQHLNTGNGTIISEVQAERYMQYSLSA